MTREEMIIELEKKCNETVCRECVRYEGVLTDSRTDCCFKLFTDEELTRAYEKMVMHIIKVPEIKDSGARTEYPSGAVRDIKENVGRCDLLPLDVVAGLSQHYHNYRICVVFANIAEFLQTGNKEYLYNALEGFCILKEWTFAECILEVSMHYKQGAEKYGERNWEKGIYLHSYIDSGVRHFLKYIDGQKDERHDRAFVWNMLGAIWTMNHRPKMIDIPFELLGSQEGEE